MTGRSRATILLWGTAAICVAAAVAALSSALIWPVKAPAAGEGAAGAVRVAEAHEEPIPPLAAFEPVLDLNLRGSLVESPATVPTAAVSPLPGKVPALSQIILIGTIVEPGHSYGIFQVGPAGVEVRGVGQKTSTGAEVMDVQAKTALVRQDGRVMPLALADTSASSSVGSLNNILAQIAQRRAEIRARKEAGLPPEEVALDDAPVESEEPEEPEEIVEQNAVGNAGKDPE